MPAVSTESPNSRLWLLLIAFLYVLFTLIPDSHSLMVQCPWVAMWQIGLLCPILWLLSQIWQTNKLPRLGKGFDIIIVITGIGLILSSLFAEFPSQARWYSWAVLGFIAALYALHQWILSDNCPQRRYGLLTFQGYLNLAFIVVSLFLWTTQTLLPELSRINQLKQYGVEISFDLSVLELRNWAPLGHQNYVAGYLILALPLLLGLGLLAKDWKRWLWWTGVGLGLFNLCTTSSRGGWLGLIGICVFGLGILAFRSQIPRLWLGLAGLGTASLLIVFIFANNRLKTGLTALIQGNISEEFAYRLINTVVGWNMGSGKALTGIGLGNVPISYQHYRPLWAGRTSESIYQLHSTPVQLWAELGIWGVLSALGLTCLLIYHFLRSSPSNPFDRVLMGCLLGGLIGYGIVSFTDYQLDNVSIGGTIVIYLACLTSYFKQEKQADKKAFIPVKGAFFAVLGLVFVMILWLVPIHRAWQLSSYGFAALDKKQIEPFRNALTKANELAPWEPYYPYQLGWNLGDIGLNTNNLPALAEGIKYFQRGNQVSPYQEFGQSNLGWLLLRQNPAEATKAFINSAQLIPAKKGVFYGLGSSLLARQQTDLAVEAMAIEAIRDPMLITSPLWRLPNLKAFYQQVLDRVEKRYGELLNSTDSERLKSYLHSSRGALFWWRGDRDQSAADWGKYGSPLGKAMLDLSSGKAIDSTHLPTGINLLLQAWKDPSQRTRLIPQAWLQSQKIPLPTNIEKELLASIEKSPNFDRWLRENAPSWQYRRQRAGFGVNSRHIDGPQPFDFLTVVDNLAVTTWFSELFTSPDYFPELDLALQPLREQLISKVQKLQ